MEQRFATDSVNIALESPGFSWIFESGLDRPETGLAGSEPLWNARKDSGFPAGLSSINMPPPVQAAARGSVDAHGRRPSLAPLLGALRQSEDAATGTDAAAAAAADAAAAAAATTPQRVEASSTADALSGDGATERTRSPSSLGSLGSLGSHASEHSSDAASSLSSHSSYSKPYDAAYAGAPPPAGMANAPGSLPGSLAGSVPGSLSSSHAGSLSSSHSSSHSSSAANSVPGSVPGSVSGSVAGSVPNSLSGSLPGSLPNSLPGSLPNSLASSVQAPWPFMPGVEYAAGLPYSAGSMNGFGAGPAGMPSLGHLAPGYGAAMSTPLNSLGPMQSVQSHGAPPPPTMDGYPVVMGVRYEDEAQAGPPPPQREVRSSAYGSQLKRCPVCQKVLRRDLTRHMRIHETVAEFRCPFPREKCNHKRGQFNRPYEYKKHLMNSHFIFNDPEESRNAPNLQERLRLEGQCHCGAAEMTVDDWITQHVGGRECPLLPQSQPHSPPQ